MAVLHACHNVSLCLLQDPVARYLSAYSMIRDNECPSETELCDVPSFSGFLSAELSRGDVSEECFFNVDVRLSLFFIYIPRLLV